MSLTNLWYLVSGRPTLDRSDAAGPGLARPRQRPTPVASTGADPATELATAFSAPFTVSDPAGGRAVPGCTRARCRAS